MIKVGIICFHNIRYMPFLNSYIDILDNNKNVSYDVIYFNRNKNLNEKLPKNYIPIEWLGKYTSKNSKISKIINFVNYQRIVKKILQRKEYDYLIVLTTIPGVLLSDYFSKNYKKRYLIDVRDYTWENLKPYLKRENKLMKYASLRVISSPDYKNFLPKYDYLLCHNINFKKNDKKLEINKLKKGNKDKIIISYIGSISYENQCLRLIDLVLDDNRFEFHFYGNESTSNIISGKISNLNDKRIVFHGPFLPTDKNKIYNSSDIIFNCYGNDKILVKYAISNKYYDGAVYHKPLIVSPNTTMQKISESFSYPLDLENIKDLNGLYDWYINLNENNFDIYCNKVINGTIKDNKDFENKLNKELGEIYEKEN